MASSPRERAPRGLTVLAGAGAAFLVLPLVALAAKAPWPVAWLALTGPETLDAIRLSAATTTAATLVSVVLGVPLAFVYARRRFPGRELLRSLTVMPMVLPPVVGGIALLLAYGRR